MIQPPVIGIHSPGDMGAAVGKVLAENGLRVVAALQARSSRTRDLAMAAGIEDAGGLEGLVRQADLLLSILVPSQAEEAAREIAAAMTAVDAYPCYVDCNAIAAGTSRRIGEIITLAGAPYVDASIIGPPPRGKGVTRFYAAGEHTSRFTALSGHGLDIRPLEGGVGQASALKTCYAALTKGVMALGAEVLVSAQAWGLEGPLREEFQLSQPALYQWLERSLPTMAPKAHRFIGEMEEHGKGFSSQGLTPGIMEGAAEFYRFAAASPIGRESPEEAPRRTLEEIAAELARALGTG